MREKGVTISSKLGAAIVIFFAFFANINASSADAVGPEGYRIADYQNVLKKVYAGATRFDEIKVDPAKSGGTTLMGLISRLMGSSPNSELEGVTVQRYLYTAFNGDKFLGVSHGSSIDANGSIIHVLVHYDADANVKGVEILDAPTAVAETLKSQKFLDQFKGYATEDFQVKYEKHRRHLISHQGRAIKEMRAPSSGIVRNYFDRVVRSLRYNVAFVDIAYFISRLPMMDLSSRRISSLSHAAGSPEAMADATQLASPTGDRSKTFTVQTPAAAAAAAAVPAAVKTSN